MTKIDHADLEVALTTLDRAQHEVVAAEAELVTLLSEIEIAPRAEKTSVSRHVAGALQRLRAALVDVEAAKCVLADAAGPRLDRSAKSE